VGKKAAGVLGGCGSFSGAERPSPAGEHARLGRWFRRLAETVFLFHIRQLPLWRRSETWKRICMQPFLYFPARPRICSAFVEDGKTDDTNILGLVVFFVGL
jgi:hypothetical protein